MYYTVCKNNGKEYLKKHFESLFKAIVAMEIAKSMSTGKFIIKKNRTK